MLNKLKFLPIFFLILFLPLTSASNIYAANHPPKCDANQDGVITPLENSVYVNFYGKEWNEDRLQRKMSAVELGLSTTPFATNQNGVFDLQPELDYWNTYQIGELFNNPLGLDLNMPFCERLIITEQDPVPPNEIELILSLLTQRITELENKVTEIEHFTYWVDVLLKGVYDLLGVRYT